MINILIIGSKGFLGRHLSKSLKNKNHNVYELSRLNGDYTKKNSINKYKNIDLIICVAGIVGVSESWKYPHTYLEKNYIGTLNVLEYCRINKTKLIFVSSYLYGNSKLKTTEKNRLYFTNPYDLSKKFSDNLCSAYNKLFDINIIILRTFNIYGPGQKKNFLIPFIIDKIKKRKKIELNSFYSKRDYLYIDDFCELISLLINYEKNFQIFNVGSGKSYTNLTIAKTLLSLLKKNNYIVEKKNKNSEIYSTHANISKLKKELNWEPKISLKKGLTKLLKL